MLSNYYAGSAPWFEKPEMPLNLTYRFDRLVLFTNVSKIYCLVPLFLFTNPMLATELLLRQTIIVVTIGPNRLVFSKDPTNEPLKHFQS